MSTKLEEIVEHNYNAAIYHSPLMSSETDWLIARARRCEKLETALRHIRERNAPTGDRAAEIEHIHAVADEALKET